MREFLQQKQGVQEVYYGPKMSTRTHFYYLGIHFSITQDICYTGFSGRSCVVRGFHKVLSVNVSITHQLSGKLHFQSHTHTSVTQKIRFRIICAIISGLIVRPNLLILKKGGL